MSVWAVVASGTVSSCAKGSSAKHMRGREKSRPVAAYDASAVASTAERERATRSASIRPRNLGTSRLRSYFLLVATRVTKIRLQCVLHAQSIQGYNYKLAAPRNVFFLPAFVTRLLTPRSRKSGYWLLLGCRSGFDAGHEKNFFSALPPQKTVKTSSGGRARHRNRSGVVELVGREPWIIARVENGVTKFSPQRQ